MRAYKFDVRAGRFVKVGADKAPAPAPEVAQDAAEKPAPKKKGRKPKNKAAAPADK